MGHSGLLLTNGTVIDVSTGNTVIADILIENDTIVIVDSGGNIPSEKRSAGTVVDVSGKWLVPGLIDMHVHINEGYAPQFVASGVTTVRNTAGNLIELRRLREASPHAPTPRVIAADRLIDGPPGCWGETSPWNLNTDDPDTARREVQRQVDAGADLIKVYGLLNRDVMRAVVEQAKQCGLDVSCDLLQSSQVTALEAARMGVKWNEHCSGFIQDMYPGWTINSSNDSWQNIDWDSPDEDGSLMTALYRVFKDEVLDGDALHFLCKTDRAKTLEDASKECNEGRNALVRWGRAMGERLPISELAKAKLAADLQTHQFYEVVTTASGSYKTWARNPLEHPLPTVDKGYYTVDCTTDVSRYTPEHLANLLFHVNNHATNAFMQQIRRRLSVLERPLVTARGDGKSYIYSNFNPKYAQYAITILRTYYNFCLPIRERNGDKATPAQRLGIADRKFNLKDIIYFK